LLLELKPYQSNSNSPLYFPPLVRVPGAGHPCTGTDVLLLPELVLPEAAPVLENPAQETNTNVSDPGS
jgi:hypothetical protein